MRDGTASDAAVAIRKNSRREANTFFSSLMANILLCDCQKLLSPWKYWPVQDRGFLFHNDISFKNAAFWETGLT